MTELVAQDIAVRRGCRIILDGVSLRAGGGDFIAVIGANGAGKSTLLSVLAGLLDPDGGDVLLDGASLASLPPRSLARRMRASVRSVAGVSSYVRISRQ